MKERDPFSHGSRLALVGLSLGAGFLQCGFMHTWMNILTVTNITQTLLKLNVRQETTRSVFGGPKLDPPPPRVVTEGPGGGVPRGPGGGGPDRLRPRGCARAPHLLHRHWGANCSGVSCGVSNSLFHDDNRTRDLNAKYSNSFDIY